MATTARKTATKAPKAAQPADSHATQEQNPAANAAADYYRKAVDTLLPPKVEEAVDHQLALLMDLHEAAQKLLPQPMRTKAYQQSLGEAWRQFGRTITHRGLEWMQFQTRWLFEWQKMALYSAQRMGGQELPALVTMGPGDRRFAHAAWRQRPWDDLNHQAYLLSSRMLQEAVEQFPPEDSHLARLLKFHVGQVVDAISPANSILSNPEAQQKAVETKGESVRKGIANLLRDAQLGRLTMTDTKAFEVGRNIAVTPGAVVYENALCQLIQYSPTTDKVAEMPLLVIPPWINKYYILDLTPETSLIRYLVDQGITVFVVSWKNVPAEMGNTTWDDYVQMGALNPMQAVLDICGTPKLNVIGYCIGGTLLASTLGYLKQQKRDIVNAASFFTAMVDFTDTGDISVYVDGQQVREREAEYQKGGVFSGNAMSNAFAFLRANDLVYNYVINNYLLGRDYTPFDLLFWNSDPTNLPGCMYAYYLRNMYLENNLRKPGKLQILGKPIDVTKVEVPVLAVACREDHIAPWPTAYTSAQLFAGETEFVLGASGHIAGVVNPPAKMKREFWHGGDMKLDNEGWLASAQNEKGSWWPYWAKWFQKYNKKQVAARTALGSKQHPVIEPAPGRYVKEPIPLG